MSGTVTPTRATRAGQGRPRRARAAPARRSALSWPGLLLALAGAGLLGAGLAAGRLPLVPAALVRLVARAAGDHGQGRVALLVVAGVLGAAALAGGFALARPRRAAGTAAAPAARAPLGAVELPAASGRGSTVVAAAALAGAGAADLARLPGVTGASVELTGEARAPLVLATVTVAKGADLPALRAGAAAAVGRLAATCGQPADAAEVVLELAGDGD